MQPKIDEAVHEVCSRGAVSGCQRQTPWSPPIVTVVLGQETDSDSGREPAEDGSCECRHREVEKLIRRVRRQFRARDNRLPDA